MLKSYLSDRVTQSHPVTTTTLTTILVLLFFCASNLAAQSSLNVLIEQVENNNKTLQTERQRVAATAQSFQTGIWLYDPQFSYDFLKGFPNSAGNQNDLILTQPFDYPTAYARRRKLAGLKTDQLAFESQGLRQDILLEAKLIGLQLIFLNKHKAELSGRLAAAQQFLDNYQKKYEARDATALDINKARHQVLNLKTSLQLLDGEIAEQQNKLTALNGGIITAFADTIYPQAAELPVFETLEQTIEASDPTLKFLQTQQQAGVAQVSLTKALSLPKMEAGYHYQGILGQNFHGLHIGLSIPLWENKNRVAQQQLQTAFYTGQVDEHRMEHYFEVKLRYEKYQNLRASLEEYRQNLQTLNNMELLDKALQAGQITTLEFFVEQSLLYDSRDRLLELEREVARAAAELLKFEL